jgi:5-methylcytosine-specific restriction endonuclease McrA
MKKGQSPNYWTDQEIEQAIQLRSQGMPYRAIGRLIGRDGTCVRRKLNEDAREQSKQACRQWYQANAEAKRNASRHTYLVNGASIRARTKKWRAANPGKRRAQALRRRSKIASSLTLFKVSIEVINERFALTSGMCCWCCVNQATTIDHFLPVSKGGTHSPSNLLPACNSCNGRKQASDPYQWFSAQPFYSEAQWQNILRMVGKSPNGRHKIHHGQISLL